MKNVQNQNSSDTDVANRGVHSSTTVRCKHSEMSGLQYSIMGIIGAPMQINHIIISPSSAVANFGLWQSERESYLMILEHAGVSFTSAT